MNIWIFNRVEEVSSSYHSQGGLVIIAENIGSAKRLISVDKYIKPTDEEWNNADCFELAEEVNERYYVMEDAGCC